MPRGFALLTMLALTAWPAAADAGCAPVASKQPQVWLADAASDTVRITFLGHASFEIVSPAGIRAVTDYNGRNIPAEPPDIATMNHAHETHYTLHPDPRIPHVLHGWREDGLIPAFDLTVGDMHVTNLPTNIRTWDGGTELYGNSIFVFETAGLCIAHLSHLHHLLEAKDIDALGHIDVVMVAVDGDYTMSQEDAAAVDRADRTPRRSADALFYARRAEPVPGSRAREYAIDIRDTPEMTISRATLPAQPTIIALPGGY